MGLSMTLQPSPRLLMTLTPSYARSTSGAQYVSATGVLPFEPTYGTRYLFGELKREDLSMVGRLNFTSFSQVTFAFEVSPPLLAQGVLFAVVIGLVGGLFPAVRAARLPIANALREQ